MHITRCPKTLLVCVLAFCACGIFTARSYRVFGPGSTYVQPFNSDSALPVLMANDSHLDAFRTYIYGQDQIGAWPFFFAQFIRRATGYTWTPEAVYLFQVVWVSLSLLLVGALCLESVWLPLSVLAATLCLHPTVSHYFFVLNQKNAWQVTALFAAWVSLRWFLNTRLRTSRWLLMTATFWFSLLSIWMSPVSVPTLFVFYALEILRLKHLRGSAENEARLSMFLTGFLPIVLAFLVEQLFKANYHRFALKHFGVDYRTPTELDWGNILVNFQRQAAVFVSAPYWPLVVVAVLGAAVLLVLMLRTRIVSSQLRLDLSILICGCVAASLLNFAVTVPFTWVRLNGYGPRYLAQTHMFGTFAGLLLFALLLSLVRKVYDARRVVFASIASLVSLVVLLKFPAVSRNPEYANLKQIAARLEEGDRQRLLLGGYWDTYVFAALADPDRIIPLPAEDQLLRTPWTVQQLKATEQVVVVQHLFPATGDVETPLPYTGFGAQSTPPPLITQHGVTLHLDVPHWFEQNGYSFSLYSRVSR